jgi:hypothetical protein
MVQPISSVCCSPLRVRLQDQTLLRHHTFLPAEVTESQSCGMSDGLRNLSKVSPTLESELAVSLFRMKQQQHITLLTELWLWRTHVLQF